MLESFVAAACASVVESVDVEDDICMNAKTTIGSRTAKPNERVMSSSMLDCPRTDLGSFLRLFLL